MLNRKILIIMADRELQQVLVDFCAALAIATVTADNVTSVPAIFQRQLVSEMIIDSLHGEWQSLVGRVRQQASCLPITLWALDGPERRQAERLGVRFVDQNCSALPALVNVPGDKERRVQQE